MPIIIYIDMNCFFVSCHQALKPWLKNKPIVVSNNSRRAVVASASYQARKYKIKSGMPLYQVWNLCPDTIKINTDFNLYHDYSNKIFNFLAKNFTQAIERCSIDEYCLDITNIYKKYGNALKCTQNIQTQILKIFDLPCSIGISYNKSLAKIASKLKKPQGISIIMKKDLKEKLFCLPINTINGIGPKSQEKLKALKIETIEDLAFYKDHQQLKQIFGKRYLSLINQAQGKSNDYIILNQKKEDKSIGKDFTLEYDSNNEKFLKSILKQLAKNIALRAQKKQFNGTTLVCGFKINQKQWKTKQCHIRTNNNEILIYQTSLNLFYQIWNQKQQIRALRIALKK